MSSRRQLRVAELLHRELADMVTFSLKDPRLAMVNVTRVEVSPDLRYAHVYVSSLDDETTPRDVVAALEHAGGFMRREIAQRTSLRIVPELSFHFDEGVLASQRINALLDDIAVESLPAVATPPADEQSAGESS